MKLTDNEKSCLIKLLESPRTVGSKPDQIHHNTAASLCRKGLVQGHHPLRLTTYTGRTVAMRLSGGPMEPRP